MQRCDPIEVGDLVVVQLPIAAEGDEAKSVRGIVESVTGDEIEVRLADAPTDDGDAPRITCKREDIVPAPLAEVP